MGLKTLKTHFNYCIPSFVVSAASVVIRTGAETEPASLQKFTIYQMIQW